MTKLQQVELKLRKKIERLMEKEGVTLVRRRAYGTVAWTALNPISGDKPQYIPSLPDCGVCALGAAVIGINAIRGWQAEDAACVLGISLGEAFAISDGFEGELRPWDPYYALGDRLRRDYCVE